MKGDRTVMMSLSVALIAALVGAPNAWAGGQPEWRDIAPGAARAEIAADADNAAGFGGERKIQLVRFDLGTFRPEVIVGDGRPPRPKTAAQVMRERGAAAVVNGGFFDERMMPLGLRIASGQKRVPLRARVDWGVLFFTTDGTARIVHSREFAASDLARTAAAPTTTGPAPPGIRDAIQVGPRLLVDGAPLKLKPQTARRTAIALDRAGKTLTLVVTDFAIDANVLAQQLAAFGFHTAMMFDGGPSTQLAVNLGSARIDIPGGYAVPDLLGLFVINGPARKPPSPSPSPSPRP